MAHIRRLLDIVACTTAFTKPRDGATKHKPSKHGRPATPPSPPAGDHGEAPPPISEAHDMAAIRPPPKLGEFYDFFSFAHITPPFHCKAGSLSLSALVKHRIRIWFVPYDALCVGFVCAVIRRKETSGAFQEGDYFEIEVFGNFNSFESIRGAI